MLYSDITKRSAAFMLSRLATAFLKARDAVVKCKHLSMLDDLKAKAKDAKNVVAYVIHELDYDLDADEVVANFCGYGREWKANAAAVEAAALEHNISHEQARGMLEATLTQAQLYSQTSRGNLAGIYAGWLADIDPDNATRSDEAEAAITALILDSYTRAGDWMHRDEGILIEAEAQDLGVILPKWADVLPQVTDKTRAAQAQITRNLDKKAEQATAQYIDAMREIDGNEW